jgi:hypothetical protein
VPVPLPAGAGRVEAAWRPARLDRTRSRGLRVRYAEDDGVARRLIDGARLAWRARGADAPAVRRLKRAGVERLAATAGARPRAARLARALRLPPDPSR